MTSTQVDFGGVKEELEVIKTQKDEVTTQLAQAQTLLKEAAEKAVEEKKHHETAMKQQKSKVCNECNSVDNWDD